MEEKVNFFLQKLKELPECRNDDFYRLADYIELKCLVNPDGSYSQKEFIDDAIQRAEDLGEGDFEANKDIKKLPNAKKKDKWEKIANDSFRVIESRINLFKEDYPFALTENKKSIQLKEDYKSKFLYILLLLCSDLKYTLKFKKELTSSFELASADVIGKLLPNAETRIFGSSNTEEEEDKEWKSDKLWDKLKWLESFLVEKLKITEQDLSQYDKGDRGIDIVSKIPSGDNLTHLQIFFAQCACSPKDWVVKQDSMKFDSWYELINLSTTPNYLMFIPQSFRDSTGDWHDRTRIKRTILFDRYRIIKNFTKPDKSKDYTSYPIVEKIMEIKESVY